VGVISIYRQEVRPFSEKQIALVTSFAAQAVIAIENTRLLNELRQRTTDLSEALEQQTATSEVLRVISSSPGDLQPVFSTMLGNAVRICEAKFGTLYLCEGDGFRALAMHNAPPAHAEARAAVVRPPPDSSLGRAAKTKEPAQVADVTKLPAYIAGDPFLVSAVAHGGYRTVLTVPMLKEDELIGAISIYCQEVRPFSDKQIELVTSFARQAVIAIENTRLLNELRQRTTDLSEALEQQTATSEVLRVISSFPGELEPVFQAMLDNAVRICEAKFGILFRYVGDAFEAVALFGVPPAYAADLQSGLRRPNPGTGLGRLAKTRRAVHIRDLCAEQAYRKRDPIRVATVEKGGARSFLAVPMLKDNDLMGAIVIYRQEVRPFTQKQVELLTNFAAQAVIAIENTRLLNELRQRTTDLGEALEQRTATSQVLEVISSSPGELEPVFTALLDNAVRLCGARFGLLYLCEGDIFRIGGAHNVPPTLVEIRKRGPFRPIPGGPVSEAARTKRPAQAADLAATSAYAERHPQSVAAVELGGVRSVLAVPMLKDGEALGVIVIFRQEVRPFTDKQIELLTNFAAQAVIAIENARLLNELRESLQQQTATADVLQVISRSAFDLQPVLDTVVESSVRLCEADKGFFFSYDGEFLRVAAALNASAELVEFLRQNPIRPEWRHSVTARAARDRCTFQTPDMQADPELSYG